MASKKIRIKLWAYEHSLVDQAAERIVETARRTGSKVSGPIPLPTEKEVVTILRAPHKYKDSREQFEQRTHKRLIDVQNPMTQIFTEDGRLIPVTVIQAGPCPVVQKKTVENDGYEAIQVGFDAYAENRAEKLVNKPLKGHFAKANVAPCRKLRELRLEDCSAYNVGDEVKVDVFAAGDKVDITGTSKGHGFTGAIARWNQHTGPMAHGSKYHRGVGSLSANSTPSRVFKNKKMSGHYGVDRVTTLNMSVVRVDAERNLLLVRGAVPGPKGGTLVIRDSVKA